MNEQRTGPRRDLSAVAISGLTLAAAVAAESLALPAPAAAQSSSAEEPGFSVEVRGGVNVPTFDIADVAEAGPSVGLGVGVALSERVWLLADGDLGFHGGEAGGPDVNVYHYIGKVGYDVVAPGTSRWSFMVNAGAGAMSFDPDAPGADTNTYFAINVGAKIGYALTGQVDLLLSPQGDIAFTDEDELTTDNAWVWPFTAGVRVRL